MSTATYYYIYNCSRYTRYNPTYYICRQMKVVVRVGIIAPSPRSRWGGGALCVLSAGADSGFEKGGGARGSRARPQIFFGQFRRFLRIRA